MITEYGRLRSKVEFFEWVENWAMEKCGLQAYQDFLARSSREDKRMIEEALLIAFYVGRRYSDDNVSVQLNSETTAWDGKLFNSQGELIENLEATIVPEKEEHIDRLIMAGKWVNPRTEGIQTRYSVADHMRHLSNHSDLSGYSDRVITAITSKLAKSYPERTTLIVGLASDMIMENDGRFNQVLTRVRAATLSQGRFFQIFLLDYNNAFMSEVD